MHAQSIIEVLLIYVSVVYIHEIILVLYIPHFLHWLYPKIRSEYQYKRIKKDKDSYFNWDSL